ncbi:hypothetical protein [Bradyrhizobium cajani]|uniref:Uncharacterized protein n=1 Tax=Bradyrhizobium cajani TaxID=1928661 RepID=A0A844TBB0_9BRAD|nr:hypothetical protein [Bradyrhizobium cajani]MCP3367719.1 hypothetical protein [Bradyrhizobium cajani]MVT73769.1 hypothetical protein [Bradyrhizobium cajani]
MPNGNVAFSRMLFLSFFLYFETGRLLVLESEVCHVFSRLSLCSALGRNSLRWLDLAEDRLRLDRLSRNAVD